MTEPQVKRYDLVYSRDQGYGNDAEMVEDAKGDYVLISDYDALALRLAECEKQTTDLDLLVRARQVADEMVKWWWTDYEPSDNWDFNKRNFEEELFVKLSKILDVTATDARREGIELAAKECDTLAVANMVKHKTEIGNDYLNAARTLTDTASHIRALQSKP